MIAVRYFIIVLFASAFSCASEPPEVSETNHQSEQEPTLQLPEVSERELRQLVESIPERRAFMLWHDGEIVIEEFANGSQADTPSNIKSASKSVMSALAGIAIEQGYIGSVSDSISKYLPDYYRGINEPGKHAITIHDLLTMSSGLRSTSFSNYGRWVVSRDWIGHALNEPQTGVAGETMEYSTGDTHLLAAVLTNAVGTDLRSFANRYLFRPMRMRLGGWDRDPQGVYFGGNNMALSPNDILKFGVLYLNGGRYNDQQIITQEWITASLTPYFENTSFNFRNHDYGYLWWRNDFSGVETWFAWGYGGQYIFLIPEMNAVAVFTSNPDVPRVRGLNARIYDVMEEGVIPYLYHK